MDKQTRPHLDQDRWAISAKDIESRIGGVLDSAIFFPSVGSPPAKANAHGARKMSKPISSVMRHDLSAVDAADTVEKVQQVLAAQTCTSVPVIGSNGAIVGIIGPQELAQLLADKKNPKVARAWEISRCTMFEVRPDDSIEDVARFMADNKLDYVAVTELGALKGLVSALDLVQTNLKENDADDEQGC